MCEYNVTVVGGSPPRPIGSGSKAFVDFGESLMCSQGKRDASISTNSEDKYGAHKGHTPAIRLIAEKKKCKKTPAMGLNNGVEGNLTNTDTGETYSGSSNVGKA